MEELARRYGLENGASDRLERLLEALISDPRAPVSARSRERALDDHIADSLVALDLPEVRAARTVADIGSGAGLPGLPLAIALPEAQFFLIESATRKCSFITRAAAAVGTVNVTVVDARVEQASDLRGRCDVVTARALAPLPVVAEYAAPLLRVGGTLLVWRGQREHDAEVEAQKAAASLGLKVGPIVPVRPFIQAQSRHLHLMSKVMETSSRFPRRAGMAIKRPLGR